MDLKKRGLKTGKQHGLAGSRRPFSNHFFSHLRCQNVASESSKKCKVSFQLLVVSLQTKPWFWTAFPAKPAAHIAPKWTKTNIWIAFLVVSMQMLYRNHTIESLVDLKKRGLKTGKQHGLAGSRRPYNFSPTSDVKTLRLNPLKNVRFRSKRISGSHFWVVSMQMQ